MTILLLAILLAILLPFIVVQRHNRFRLERMLAGSRGGESAASLGSIRPMEGST